MERHELALLIAFAKIKWPPSKYRLACYVLANDSGSPAGTVFSQEATAAETGMSATSVRAYLRELVDARVLHRLDGSGSRGHAFRINPRFDQWIVAWLGADPRCDDRHPAKREAAIAHLAAVENPPAPRKSPFVARPGARQLPIAARSAASLFGPFPTPGRATTDPGAPHPGARQLIAPIAADTIPSNLRTIDRSNDELESLIGTIALKAKAPVMGAFGDRVRAAVNGLDSTAIEQRVRDADPNLRLPALVALVEQACAGARAELLFHASRSNAVTAWSEPEPDEPPAGDALGQLGAARAALRNPANGVPSCETAPIGGGGA